MAYNGEAYGAFGLREWYPRVQWIPHSLEDQNATMVIPWEVDQEVLKQIVRILLAFWTETEVSCSK